MPVFDLSYLLSGKTLSEKVQVHPVIQYSVDDQSVGFAVNHCDSGPTQVARILARHAQGAPVEQWVVGDDWEGNRRIIEFQGYMILALQNLLFYMKHEPLSTDDDIPF